MNERAIGILFGLLAAVVWAGFPVVTRLGVAHAGLDPYDVAFLRFSLAGALLFPMLLRNGLRTSITSALLMVVGVGAPYIIVVAAALSQAEASLFALTVGSMIAFTAILGYALLKERLSLVQGIGIVIVVFGVGLAADTALSTSGMVAILLFLLGGLLWAIYNLTAKSSATPAFQATAIVAVGSLLCYDPVYLWFRGLAVIHQPLGAILLQAIYQGIFVSILGLYFFSRAIDILGPAIGATLAALVPLLATVEAAWLLGERPPMSAIIGIVIVAVGVVFSALKPGTSQ